MIPSNQSNAKSSSLYHYCSYLTQKQYCQEFIIIKEEKYNIRNNNIIASSFILRTLDIIILATELQHYNVLPLYNYN